MKFFQQTFLGSFESANYEYACYQLENQPEARYSRCRPGTSIFNFF